MRLTEHFTLEELTLSQTALRLGVDNTPTPEIVKALRHTAAGLERIRAIVGQPLFVTSGYRSPQINALIGGSKNSQHCHGEAADITCPGLGSAMDLARLIEEHIIAINPDQIILEFDRWVHVSFSITPRRAVLTMRSKREGYLSGLVSPNGDVV